MNVLLLQTAQVEKLSIRQEIEEARDAFELEVARLRETMTR